MKKYDKRIKQAGVVLFISISMCILLCYTLFNSEAVFEFGKKIIKIISPFIYGFFIAYILNPVMVYIETKIIYPIYKKLHSKSKKPEKKLYIEVFLYY